MYLLCLLMMWACMMCAPLHEPQRIRIRRVQANLLGPSVAVPEFQIPDLASSWDTTCVSSPSSPLRSCLSWGLRAPFPRFPVSPFLPVRCLVNWLAHHCGLFVYSTPA
ncbi:hypothetical protein IWX92DRAFT_113501 [Phyllosticta citricarpa]